MDANPVAIMQSAESEGRGVYLVMGGELVNPGSYRSDLESAWGQAVNGGGSVSNSTLTRMYKASGVAFAAANFRCQTISDVPLMIADNQGARLDYHPFEFFLTTAPTIYWYSQMSLIIWGVTYLRKWYNSAGYPSALEWVHPDDVTPQEDMYHQITGYYIADTGKHYNPSQIIEIRAFDPERSLNGKSEFEVALADITTDQNLVRYAGAFFFNSARPDGMLISKHALKPGERAKAEAEWKKFKGSKHAWKTFVSSSAWEWVPITPAPVDLAMTELSADTRRNICVIIKTNPALIGAADVSDPLSAGATFREIKRNHIENVTLPDHQFISRALTEQWLYRDFYPRNHWRIMADESAMPILSDITAERSTIAVTLTSPTAPIADYDEARGVMGLPERTDYFKRNPSEAAQVWNSTGISLDEFRFLAGLKPLGLNGQVYRLSSGQLIPSDKLYEYAQKQFELASAPPPTNPFGGNYGLSAFWPLPNPPAPAAPNPPAPPALPAPAALKIRTVRNDGETGKAAIMLMFESDPQIAAIQTLLRFRLGTIEGYEWAESVNFHITLLYCEDLDKTKEPELYSVLDGVKSFPIEISGLGTFDNDKTAVVLLAKVSDELAGLQSKLYAQAEKLGAQISEYSNPDDYKPHITLCYAPLGAYTAPDEFPVNITVYPSAVIFSREVYEYTHKTAIEVPARSLGFMPTQRQAPLEFAVIWRENNFILMAQRLAAGRLADSGIETPIDWNNDVNGWRLPLAICETLSGAAKIVKAVTLGDQPQIDFFAAGYVVRGDLIGLSIQPNENLERARAALRLELDGAGIENAEPDDVWFIPLGKIENAEPDERAAIEAALNAGNPDQTRFPLVGQEIALFVNGEPRNVWELTRSSSAQTTELNQWRRKATGRRGRGAPFETRALNGTLAESFIRAALANLESDDKGVIDAIFNRAQRILVDGLEYQDSITPTPQEFRAYWNDYDSLQSDLGRAWLDYMARAQNEVLESITPTPTPDSIMGILSKHHEQLAAEWVGTEESPGDLTALIMAGMGAGNSALIRETSMNPARASAPLFAQGLTLDWTLLSEQALNFARNYSFGLIRGIDRTTQEKVRAAVESWLQSGEALPSLKAALRGIFEDANRAALIAQTESIRAYNEGAFERWRQVGVKKAVWRTVNDPLVCPICRPLNGQVGEFDAGGWVHPGGVIIEGGKSFDGTRYKGNLYRESAHPGCRCFRRPLVESAPVPDQKPAKPKKEIYKSPLSDLKIDEYVSRLSDEFAPIRQELQRNQDKLYKALDNIESQRAELETGFGATYRAKRREWMNYEGDDTSDESKALRAEYLDLEDAYLAKVKELRAIESASIENARARAQTFIRTNNPAKFKTVKAGNSPFTDMMKKRFSEAESWLSEIVDGAVYPDGFTVPVNRLRAGGRAYHSQGTIYINKDDSPATVIHEIAHAIEYQHPDVLARAAEFLRYRTQGDSPVSLRAFTKNKAYEEHETAIPDNFKNPYVGKLYQDGNGNIRATELISMGLQWLYENPYEFSQSDPEFFNFILSITRRLT